MTQQKKAGFKLNREQILSIIFLLGGLFIILLATNKVDAGDTSGFTQFRKDEALVDLPSRATLWG